MSYPLPVPQNVEDFLTTASDHELHTLAAMAASDPALDEEGAACVVGLCQYELSLRQQEPLWRKASRAGRRWWNDNDNEVQKVGVGALAGLLLGIWLE